MFLSHSIVIGAKHRAAIELSKPPGTIELECQNRPEPSNWNDGCVGRVIRVTVFPRRRSRWRPSSWRRRFAGTPSGSGRCNRAGSESKPGRRSETPLRRDRRLANPANDARLIAETLRGLGFDVIERIDADLETIQLATFELQDLLFAAGKDAVGLFFYAGHGVQVRGQNYLIPLNSNIEKEREVAIKAVSAGFVLKQMEFAGNEPYGFVDTPAYRAMKQSE